MGHKDGAYAWGIYLSNPRKLWRTIITHWIEQWLRAQSDDGRNHGRTVIRGYKDYVTWSYVNHLQSQQDRGPTTVGEVRIGVCQKTRGRGQLVARKRFPVENGKPGNRVSHDGGGADEVSCDD